MEIQEFVTLHVSGMRINDLFSLNKSTIDYAKPVVGPLGGIPAAVLAQLESDNQAMGAQMNKSGENQKSSSLAELDDDRDDRFAEIKRNITTDLIGRDVAKKAAAENLKRFFKPYWNVEKRVMNTGTGIFSEMLQKYNDDENLKADAATIGIAEMLTGLETANTGFNTLYKARNSEEASEEPSASSFKRAATQGYNHFCLAMELQVNYAPTDAVVTLFGQMNELRKTYAALNGRKTKEEETTEEATGTE
ncbi:DUF6261 family protein [Prolixibacter sp. SD074]|uniref:DUF6261 family protein n=1 Tax=Prolixibacter sp. SD074 TaxID=2652391 RepID=UPI0012796E3B|nr:DUF6261 family protein [Prolixibacter sp. SD074]GET29741.1 hypothetical protein SD074_19430 [Prolixibacter sp. SD074]